MKIRICVCGHNYFVHEKRSKHVWNHVFKPTTFLRITFSNCRLKECLCENFIEAEESVKGRISEKIE